MLTLSKSIAWAEMVGVDYFPPADRAYAITCLGEMKSLRAEPLLIQLCEDANGCVQAAAIGALSEIRGPRTEQVLAKIAADSAARSVAGATSFHPDLTEAGIHFLRYGRTLPETTQYDLRRIAQLALTKFSNEARLRAADRAIAQIAGLNHEALRRRGHRPRTPEQRRRYVTSSQYKKDYAEYKRAYDAIRVIGRTDRPRGTVALVSVLGCGNENIEWNAASSLCQRPAKDVLPHIRQVLSIKDATNLTLTACLEVILTHDPPAARPLARRLVERLKTAGDFHRFPHRERSWLIQALTSEDVPLLNELAAARDDPHERDVVTELIDVVTGKKLSVDFVDAEEIPPKFREAAIGEFLVELDKQTLDWRMFKAMYQLGRLKEKRAVPGLLRHLQQEVQGGYAVYKGTASGYQTMAGWALIEIGDEDSVAKIRSIALDRSRHYSARSAALVAYSRMAKGDATSDLRKILLEPDKRLQVWARTSFGIHYSLSTHRGPIAIFPQFNSVHEAVAASLAEIGSPAASAALMEYVRSSESVSLGIAAAAFRVSPRALDTWSLEQLRSTRESHRVRAICIRYAFFTSACDSLALRILKDRNHSLWLYTIRLLRRNDINNDALTQMLISQLRAEKSCNMRLRFIDAISQQGGDLAETALIEFAELGKME